MLTYRLAQQAYSSPIVAIVLAMVFMLTLITLVQLSVQAYLDCVNATMEGS